MSRLTRDGTAEPVSRDQILRRERGQGDIHFSFSADPRGIGNLTRLIHTLAILCMTIHYVMIPVGLRTYSLFVTKSGIIGI